MCIHVAFVYPVSAYVCVCLCMRMCVCLGVHVLHTSIPWSGMFASPVTCMTMVDIFKI